MAPICFVLYTTNLCSEGLNLQNIIQYCSKYSCFIVLGRTSASLEAGLVDFTAIHSESLLEPFYSPFKRSNNECPYSFFNLRINHR